VEAYSLATPEPWRMPHLLRRKQRLATEGSSSRELPLMMPCSKSFGSIPPCTLGSSRASQATHPPKQMPDQSPFLYHSITPTSRRTDPAFAGSVSPYQTTSPTKPHRLSALSPTYLLSAICYLSSRRSRVYAPNRPSEAISASQRA
jgi:hypothetical protein